MNYRFLNRILVFSFLCASCQDNAFLNHQSKPSKYLFSSKNSLNFLIFGDSGTGDKWQYKIAHQMKRSCQKFKCQYGLLLGDNFYSKGVSSVTDPQFYYKFEKPYQELKIPIYAVLGNHDYGQGISGIKAQIEYTQHSDYWNMKNRYYRLDFNNLEILALDTQNFDLQQQEWLSKQLSKVKKKWRIVIAHHPIYAYGGHGHNLVLEEKLLPKLCGRVDGYFTGHEHNLQYLTTPCINNITKEKHWLKLFIAGAAAKIRDTHKGKLTQFQKTTRGYLLASVHKSKFKIFFVGSKGEILFRVSNQSRKATSGVRPST